MIPFSPMFGIAAAVAEIETVKWLLSLNINLTAAVGPDAIAGGTSVTYIEEWHSVDGVRISNPAVPAGIPCSRGMRKSTDTDEGGSVAAPVFLNSVSKVDATLLHPVKTGARGEGIFLLYDHWTAKTYSSGDKVYVVGTDNHNYALSSQGGPSASMPSVEAGDIGGTVSDGVVTWDVKSYYSNLATADDNYLPHVLSELVGVNVCSDARDFDGTGWDTDSGSTTFSKDQTGIDGTANSATTISDVASAGFDYATFVYTSVIGQSDSGRIYVKKTVSQSTYPAIGFVSVGGSDLALYIVNSDDGTLTGYTGNSGVQSTNIESFNVNFWEITIEFEADSTSSSFRLYGAVNSDGSGDLVASTQGSAVFDWVDIILNTDTVGSPIFTDGGTVTRDATEFLVTPDTGAFLRLRFADVISQTYLSSGTIEVSYDGTTLTWTDGTNAMTHIVAMAPGDFAVVEESTGKLYYGTPSGSTLVDTNGSYSPSWGEIALGNAVDYRFDDNLDPTDTTWSEPA